MWVGVLGWDCRYVYGFGFVRVEFGVRGWVWVQVGGAGVCVEIGRASCRERVFRSV